MEILNTYVYFFGRLKQVVGPFLAPLKYILVIVFAGFVLLSLAPLFLGNSFQSLVVKSSSMEPTIPAGALVFVRATPSVSPGDVVTFRNPKDPQNKFTHRVVRIENNIITTKGDANDQPDPWKLTPKDIVGKAVFSVPYLGYLVAFSKTPLGFAILILLPALLIIVSELATIKNELEKKYAEKYKNNTVAISLALISSSLVISVGSTHAYFWASETSANNLISAGAWSSAIVINEFMPDPSAVADADGEWLELYNTTGDAIDLSGWELKDANGDSHTISGPLSIATGGYLVLCRNDESSDNGGVPCDYEYADFILANDDDEIILKNDLGDEVDRVEYTGAFPFGNGISAELKDPSLHNNNKDNWEAAATTYGDGDYGTPGAAN